MVEPRDLALVRNVIAILWSLDRHELEPISDLAWARFRSDPSSTFLTFGDARQLAIWAAIQRRLPAPLREASADQVEQERLREFIRPDCPRCREAVKRVQPSNLAAGAAASVTYACGCVYADEDLDAVVMPRVVEGVGG